MPTYAGYFRTSSEKQEEKATIQTQLSAARSFEEQHRVKVALRYLDDGVSSRVPFANRPEGARLMRDARSGLFTHVVVQDFTRVGFALDMLRTAEELEACGVKIVSIMEPLPGGGDASVATLLRTILASFGQYRVDTIRHKSVAGQERAAREGRWNGGVPPFGYTVSDRRLEACDAEAEVVRLVFRLYVEEGYRLRPLATYLNSRGVPPPRAWRGGDRSMRWHIATVSKMLNNPLYVGRATWRKTGTGRGPSGERLRAVSLPEARVEFAVPPLVSEETFERARRLLGQNFNDSKRNAKHHDYILRGLLRCGACGRAYVGYASGDKDSFYYRCNSSYVPAERCGARVYVNAPRAEAEVWRKCLERINNPRLVKEELRRRLESEAPDRAAAEREAAEVGRLAEAKAAERARVINLVRRGLVSEDEAARELEQLQDEAEMLRAQKAEIGRRLFEAGRAEERVRGVGGLLKALREKAETAEGWQRAEVMREMIGAIVVTPVAGAKPAYRLDLEPRI